ncbi:hypothetical protein [Caballeronia sp. S22]|uniref:hypothetical protein n=1 Tax=Caballeronia sp. S22 TaxID=3137182 RepID=UPI0035305831
MESAMPRSTVHANGRTTTVPKKVRHALRLQQDMTLVWTVSYDESVTARVKSPLPGGLAHFGTAGEKKGAK